MLKEIAGNFHQEKNFANFATCSHQRNFFYPRDFSCIKDLLKIIMVSFTVLANVISVMQKIGWHRLGEIFPLQGHNGIMKFLDQGAFMYTLNSLPQQSGVTLALWYLPQAIWHCILLPRQPYKCLPPEWNSNKIVTSVDCEWWGQILSYNRICVRSDETFRLSVVALV